MVWSMTTVVLTGSKTFVISIKVTLLKISPPNQRTNNQQKHDWSSILKLRYELIYEHCCSSEELLSFTRLALITPKHASLKGW